MIPHGTIEKLEDLIRLIDSKKDYQDERVMRGTSYRPDYELDEQLFFPPPELTNGKVTENSLYHWIPQLIRVFQAEQKRSAPLLIQYLSVYHDVPLPEFIAPLPHLGENGEEPTGEANSLAAAPNQHHGKLIPPVVLADDGTIDDQVEYKPTIELSRFLRRGFTDLGLS